MIYPYLYYEGQRGRGDCSVCCLSMLLVVSYEDALEAMSHVAKHPHRGMYFTDVQKAAARLGRTLRSCRRFDIETASGILHVKRTRKTGQFWSKDHSVILREGTIIDPADRLICFDPEIYVKDNGAIFGLLLVLEES